MNLIEGVLESDDVVVRTVFKNLRGVQEFNKIVEIARPFMLG
jgi:hypothetical protein